MAVFLLHQLLLQRASMHLEGTGFPLENMPFKSIKNYFHELQLFTCKPVIQMMCAFTLAHRELSTCSFFGLFPLCSCTVSGQRKKVRGPKGILSPQQGENRNGTNIMRMGLELSLPSWNEDNPNTAQHPGHTPAQRKLGEAKQSFEVSSYRFPNSRTKLKTYSEFNFRLVGFFICLFWVFA